MHQNIGGRVGLQNHFSATVRIVTTRHWVDTLSGVVATTATVIRRRLGDGATSAI